MSGDKISTKGQLGAEATLSANSGEHLGQRIKHTYKVECYGPDGALKWQDGFDNLVTTVGLNQYLTQTLVSGTVSPLWYIGLITGPGSGNTYVAADTSTSHAGWTENSTYSNATRPQWNPGSVVAGEVDNSASKAIFNINGTATIAGCFMINNSTIGGSTGVLLGEGNFTGGDRLVQNGDTLNVTVSATQS